MASSEDETIDTTSVKLLDEARTGAATMAKQPTRGCMGLTFPHMMVLLSALCGLLNYADRVNMSVAIISLGKAYNLTVSERGIVLSAFFYGYTPSQLISAILCRRYGAKRILGIGAAGWSLFTFFTPIAASYGMKPLVLCRVLMGLTEGVAFPSIYHVFGEWVPSNERGRAMAALSTGVGVGTTIALVASPHIIRIFGWEAVFYIFGAAGGIWLFAWVILAKDKSVKVNESSTGYLSLAERRAIAFMLRNRTCLALMATQFLSGLFHYTCLSWLPTYFAAVFNLRDVDVWFTFVPYATSACIAPLGGVISDGIATKYRSKTIGRKVTTALSCCGGGVMVLAFASARTVPLAVLAISVALGMFSLSAGGYDAAYLDISEPSYAGLMKSVANTLGAASGALATALATRMFEFSHSWRFVFAITSTWAFAAAAVFVRFGSSNTVLTDARFLGIPNTKNDLIDQAR